MPSFIRYDEIIEKEAVDFIHENMSMFIEGFAEDSDLPDIRGFDRMFSESIVDRAYSAEDAQFIMDHCDNPETDTGLWEGSDPEDALIAQAGHSFANDVRAEIEKIYDRIKDQVIAETDDWQIYGSQAPVMGKDGRKFDRVSLSKDQNDSVDALYNEDGTFIGVRLNIGAQSFAAANEEELKLLEMPEIPTAIAVKILNEEGNVSASELESAAAEAVAKREIESLIEDSKPRKIEPGSDEERIALRDFIRLGRKVSRSDYPVGHAYIDARCGYMYGTEEFAYVWTDNLIRLQLPHLQGKTQIELKEYYKETFGGPAPSNAEEMLAKIHFLIEEGADSEELRELLPEIKAMIEGASAPSP